MRMDGKELQVAVLALIIGAAGMIFGVVAVSTSLSQTTEVIEGEDGADGEDGEDLTRYGTVYYCSSGSEVQDAIDSIGTGDGTIIIVQDIILSATIDIDQGGNLIIEGIHSTTIHIGGNWAAFDISDASGCILRDLNIDATDVGKYRNIIEVNESNNNYVEIFNVHIEGGVNGIGFRIYSENVLIENCFVNGTYQAIELESTCQNVKIKDNHLHDIDAILLWLDGSNIVVESNYLSNPTRKGTLIYDSSSSNSSIFNNRINAYNSTGIFIFNSENNLYSGNYIHSFAFTTFARFGIFSTSGTTNASITNNVINGFIGVDDYGLFFKHFSFST